MSQYTTRRQFLAVSASVTSAMGIAHLTGLKLNAADDKPLYEISLAQWSLHKTLYDGKLDNLDFAKTAKRQSRQCALCAVNGSNTKLLRCSRYHPEMNVVIPKSWK